MSFGPFSQAVRFPTLWVATALCAGIAFAGCMNLDPIELASHSKPAAPDAASPETDTPTEPSTPDGPWYPTTRRYHIELTWRRAPTTELPTVPGGAVGDADASPASPTSPGSPSLPTSPESANPSGETGLPELDPDFGTELEPEFDSGLGTDTTRELGPPSGADLDLHFLHPFAVGRDLDGDDSPDGWFDVPFDVHWANPNPTWGKAGGDDDGRLDRDDRFGPGPEVVSLDHCEDEGFEIGVHAFTDTLGTPTEARVDVYLDGVRTFSIAARLLHQDFWEVGTLRCDGQVDRHDRIIPSVAVTGSTR